MFYIVASRIDASRHDSCVAPLTRLILPEVICLSQRLSHACLSCSRYSSRCSWKRGSGNSSRCSWQRFKNERTKNTQKTKQQNNPQKKHTHKKTHTRIKTHRQKCKQKADNKNNKEAKHHCDKRVRVTIEAILRYIKLR